MSTLPNGAIPLAGAGAATPPTVATPRLNGHNPRTSFQTSPTSPTPTREHAPEHAHHASAKFDRPTLRPSPPPEVLPADKFYWAFVSTPPGVQIRTSTTLMLDRAPAILSDSVQDQTPVPLDTLHGVLIPLKGKDRRSWLLGCMARKSFLASGGLVRRPVSLPSFLQSELHANALDPHAVDLRLLNLLVGTFEPASLRTAKRRRRLLALLAAAIALVALFIGFERRASAHRAHAAKVRTEIARIADAAAPLPPNTDPTMDTIGPLGRLDAAQSTMRLTHRGSLGVEAQEINQAGDSITALLAAWPQVPDETDLRTRGVSITPNSIVVTVDLAGDPRPFLGSLRSLQGWRLVEPGLSSVGERTQITLQFKPIVQPSGDPP